jgi:hypothetical protein
LIYLAGERLMYTATVAVTTGRIMLLTSSSKYLGVAALLIGSLAGTAFADVYDWTLLAEAKRARASW